MKASELTKLFQTWTVHQVHRQPRFLNDASSQLAGPASILFDVEIISIALAPFFINTLRLETERTHVLISGFLPARRATLSQATFLCRRCAVCFNTVRSHGGASQRFDGFFKDQWGHATWEVR